MINHVDDLYHLENLRMLKVYLPNPAGTNLDDYCNNTTPMVVICLNDERVVEKEWEIFLVRQLSCAWCSSQ